MKECPIEGLELLRTALTAETFYHVVHGAIAISAEIQALG
jgi:hypothetical protein